jgi:F0F1-type ATP synthase membrane subunit b/b'
MAGTANAGASSATTGGDDGVKEQAQEKAQEVREQAGEQMRKATGQARDRMRDQVDQRSTQAGDQVHQQASDLRDVAQSLRDQGKEGPAKIAEQVAERAERAGSWMKESDADRILNDVEDFARSKPWAVAAGGLALGFAASRMLKASSSRRYEERMSTDRQLPAAGQTATARETGLTDPLATPMPPPVPPAPAAVDDPLGRPAPEPGVSDPLRTPGPGGPQ